MNVGSEGLQQASERARQLAVRRRRAFVAVSFVLCLAYADLFTSGLGCTTNQGEKETDGGAGGSIADLAVPEMVDASAEPEMADISVPPVADSTVPDVGASDVTVGDVTVSDVTVADVTVADVTERDVSEVDVSVADAPNDGPTRSLPDGDIIIPTLDGGWQCTSELDCPKTGGEGYGYACCLGARTATCVAIATGGSTPCPPNAMLCEGPTDETCPYGNGGNEPCDALDASAPRGAGTVPLYSCYAGTF